MFDIGTSGFLFSDWAGSVYPRGLPRGEWLGYYERALGFRLVELNCTFYSLIAARSLERMIDHTTPAFRFVLKAHHALTHGPPSLRVLERFRGTLDLFRAAGRFAGTLAQFPPRFLPLPRNVAAVAALRGALGAPFFAEFRCRGWEGAFVRSQLEARNVRLCAPDLPPLRALPRLPAYAPAGTAYLRLHGRNPLWFERPDRRYDYRYSDVELGRLAGLVRKMRETAGRVMILFNNCHAGHAARDALRLAARLRTADSGRGP